MTVALWFARDDHSGENTGDPRRKSAGSSSDASSALAASASFVRDAALLTRIRSGDAHALMELMRHHLAQLTTVVAALLGTADTAQDIIHDVFVAFWDHRDMLDSNLNVAGYLHRAVRNRTLNVLKHERSQKRIAQNAAALDFDCERTAHNEGERTLDEEDINAQLQVALAHLPPRLREVFWLRWSGELSYDEIGALLGISTKTVTQQMYRATRRLTAVIRQDFF